MSDDPKVALVNMPFASGKYPSIQLGTLSALLKAQGTAVASHHLNLTFAYHIGPPLYEALCEKRGLLGEWLFSHLLFRDNPKNSRYIGTFKPVFEDTARETGCSISFLEEIKTKHAPKFLSQALTEIEWDRYRVVGFTSMFDQNVASLTLAKLIKDLCPQVRIVFGGANYDGEMGLEYFRAFPWIDYVVVGEGEVPFPALVKRILEGREDEIPPGVAYRRENRIHFTPNPHLFTEFHRMPPPDYDDYFTLLDRLDPQAANKLNRILLFEGSRGCWWGEKHHCTFCGLNSQAMEFRSKTPEQAFEEMRFLSNRYNTSRFRFVDNIIEMKYIDGLFGKLASEKYDLDIFIETKSNLTRRQIQTLAHGGLRSVQPGIESLSQAQLKEMDKGVSPLQNLVTLKWMAYYDIHVSWNILLGFPEETNEDYRRQIHLVPSILHLQPPEVIGELWLERFSPYFKWPEKYGIRILGPGLAYEYVYDPGVVKLDRIAYDFEFELVDKCMDPSLIEELTHVVRAWKRLHTGADRPFLVYAKAIDYVTIFDGRNPQKPVKERYEWPHAFVIDFCNDAPKYLAQIRGEMNDRRPGAGYDEESVLRALDELLEKRILYEEKGRYFTLALPANQTH